MKGTPRRLGRSFWSLLRGQIFLLLRHHGMYWTFTERALGHWQFFPAFSCQYLCICMVRSMKPHRKKKNINFILPLAFFLVFFTPSKPTRKFHRPEKTAAVCWERSMLYILLYYHVEETNPSKTKPRSACPVAKTSEGSAYLYGRLIVILFFSDIHSC